MALAYARFRLEKAARWDDELSDVASSSQDAARKARERMAMEIAQRESVHQHHQPSAVEMRHHHADLYYDHHRTAQVADASSSAAPAVLGRHTRTKGIAAALMHGEVSTIEGAIRRAKQIAAAQGLDALAQERAAREGAREFILWQHSVALDDVHRFANGETYDMLHHHLSSRGFHPTLDEMRGLDASLDASFAGISRGPHFAYMAIMKPKGRYGPAAQVITDPEHPHVGSMALSKEATRDDLTREFAQSLARRHLAPEFEAFASGLSRRTKGDVCHVEHYSDHGFRSQAGPAGDPLAEFGHTYSRALAGHTPAQHPGLARQFGPTRRSVEDLSDIMPGYSAHPGAFKESAIGDDSDNV
jgi:hypothetical protein